MKIACIIFDGITWLDFIGIYDPLCRLQKFYLPEAEIDICARTETATDSFGLEIKAQKVLPYLAGYDMIIVPGGYGTRDLQHDDAFMSWFSAAKEVPYKVSICTGSLLLGAAGFLNDAHATTHFDEYQSLASYAKEVHKDRIVQDGKIITAGAVASSLDLGLYICELFAGKEARERIRKSMDYRGPEVQVKVIK